MSDHLLQKDRVGAQNFEGRKPMEAPNAKRNKVNIYDIQDVVPANMVRIASRALLNTHGYCFLCQTHLQAFFNITWEARRGKILPGLEFFP